MLWQVGERVSPRVQLMAIWLHTQGKKMMSNMGCESGTRLSCLPLFLLGFFISGATFGANRAQAGHNPWSRAIGEAVELQDATEDLRNRLNREYVGSYASQVACGLDETASGLREMIKCGTDYDHIQISLQEFDSLRFQLCHIIAQDCRIHHDSGVERYKERVDHRFKCLVEDLRKCKIPVPACYDGSVHDYRSGYGQLPQPFTLPQPGFNEAPRSSSPYLGSPNITPSEPPRYWQGSTDPRSRPDAHAFDTRMSQAWPSLPPQNVNEYRRTSEHSVAADILSMLLRHAATR
jgi:hypothetical protein